jgi:DNA-binding IclR family transcriptional regulator
MTMLIPLQPGADAAAGDPNSVLGKVRHILESFTADSDELSLAELVRRSGVAKATVHRLAAELVEWGLLERSGTRYRLGLRMFELGQIVPRQRILREAALPYMQDLLAATGETIHFAIREGLCVMYVEKIIGHRGLRQESRVAGRMPLHSTATGKAIMAFSPPSLLEDVIGHGLAPVTRYTITSPGVLRLQVGRIRDEEVAMESEETRLGYMSMAVPVFGRRSALAGAMSVTAPTTRMNAARFSGALRAAAAGVTRTLQAMSPGPGARDR